MSKEANYWLKAHVLLIEQLLFLARRRKSEAGNFERRALIKRACAETSRAPLAAVTHFPFIIPLICPNFINLHKPSSKYQSKMVMTRSQARKVPVRHLRLPTPRRPRKVVTVVKEKRKRYFPSTFQ